MAPKNSSNNSSLVFFTFKRRKVAFVRPETHDEAIRLAKKTFGALSAVPEARIAILARLPEYDEEGVVEIAPEAWQLATRGVNSFNVEMLAGDLEYDKVEPALEVEADAVKVPTRSWWESYIPVQQATGPRNQSLSIFVKTLTGKVITMDWSRSDSVFNLKARIEDKEGIPPTLQILCHKGRRLEDSYTLTQYGIQSEDTVHLILGLRGAKPVIYLYPPSSIKARVQLSLVPQWKLFAVYPRPVEGSFKEGRSAHFAEWNVIAHPCGMMTTDGTSDEFAYIFWEAETEASGNLLDSPPTSRPASPLAITQPAALHARAGFTPGFSRCTPQDSVFMSVQEAPRYLERALRTLGLHTEARTSFITYWLPSFLKHKHIALRFVPQADYEASAPLSISPQPDVVTRIFMLFEGVPTDRSTLWQEARERSSVGVEFWKGVVGVDDTRQRDASLFRVLEWGGMEVR